MTDPTPLRHAVVGVGAGIFSEHRAALDATGSVVSAVSDLDPVRGRARADELGCPFYPTLVELLARERVDVVVILTPHPSHAALAVTALDAGCHVLVEKPMAIEVAEADAMLAAARRAGRVLAVNFQQRFRPEIAAARRLLETGALGALRHVDLVASWPRTARYFASATWRATWAGEGGGVLMNQAPHQLDLLCHLVGPPARVRAWARTALHAIETEDTVDAALAWEGGARGSLHISTAEVGRPERLEVVGTRGYLQVTPGGVVAEASALDFADFARDSELIYRGPDLAPVALDLPAEAGDHAAVYRDLHRAVRSGTEVRAGGPAGLEELELANAMLLSSHEDREVELPVDRAAYHALLERLRAPAAARSAARAQGPA